MVAPWVDCALKAGAPAEALLVRAGIRPELVEQPAAVVPLKRALRWVELACRSLGTEHLGVHVGRATPIEALGPYGRVLAGTLTLGQYLHQGLSLYGTVVVGQRIWLSAHGSRLRVNLGAPWEPELGDYQARLHFLAVTSASIRRFAGPAWTPTEIGLGYDAREPIPEDVFGDVPLMCRPGHAYLELPRTMLSLRARQDGQSPSAAPASPPEPLPRDLAGLVALQIESLLPGRPVSVDVAAETLGMRRRSLQRGLAAEGISYTDLLSETRLRLAAEWLERTDKPVVEIALDLGYADASNFTRAFRRATGVSPSMFRKAAGRH
jgi:AraC-like DNA-binding protein